MKISTLILIIALAMAAALLSANASAQQNESAEVLLGAALHQEEVEGNLEAAIKTYQKVLAEHPDNRPIAARALLQIGQCYERLGIDEARKAYEQLLRDYADQFEQAKLARSRLFALDNPGGAGQEDRLVARQVWSTPDMGNIEGAPSPDGRFLSFVDWDTGDLAIRDLHAGTTRRLTDKGSWEESEEFAMFSRWSPDGKLIAYDWYNGESYDLRVIAPEGGDPRVLVDGEWLQTCDWSPDGKQILIGLLNEDGTSQIVLVSAVDGTTKAVKTFKKGEFSPGYPEIGRFSRDGQYIAYDPPQQENSLEHDIFLITIDGSREVRLVAHPAEDLLFGWSPDGKGILFASDRTGSLDMWFLPVSGGKAQGAPVLVKTGLERSVPLGFTQDGSFYYTQGQWMLDVYEARIDFQSGRILESPELLIKRNQGRNSFPGYSADGKYLAYLTTRSRVFQSALRPNILRIRSLESGEEQEFPTTFERLGGTRWAPDGRHVYTAAWDDQGMGIVSVNVENGEITPIVRTEHPARIVGHQISADGKALIYERRDRSKGPFRILSHDLTTGVERVLYEVEPPDRVKFSVSPDGRRLALMNMDKKKALRVMPMGGGKPTELLRFEDSRNFWPMVEWTADGKYILFTRRQTIKDKQETETALWRIPAEGGEPQELNIALSSITVLEAHPDRQRLAFHSTGFTMKSPAVWVLQNFLPPAASE